MSASITLPTGALLCHLPAPFALQHGGELRSPVLAYERQGPIGAPVVVVLGGISAGRHVSAHARAPEPGWWDEFVGPGRAIDTERVQVLAIDWLGGIGASSGPVDGETFPFTATQDQANAIAALLDRLRIERLAGWVGSSYGGMVGLQFAALHPQRLDRLVCLGAAHRSHPQASAWRAVQRAIVELGVQQGCAPQALALARQLAMTTYRSPRELAARFAAPPRVIDGGALHTPVQEWLRHHGCTFAARWTPAAFACLNASIDGHLVEPAEVRVATTLIAFASDQLVPVEQVRELAAALPHCEQLHEVATIYGHDAFLKEPHVLAPLLRAALREVLA